MRHYRVGGSIIGVMLVASACAIPAGAGSSSRFTVTPTEQPDVDHLDGAARDSVFAQAVADREGPRVTIRAEFSNISGSRRARALFHTEDDAYVLIGHIDADGVLRISFPTNPRDDGFVHGQKSYSTPDFFAGFADEYAYRYQTQFAMYHAGPVPDSYDGGIGYVFVIASWRPLRFDRFATDGEWNSYELADADFMQDPRPAIHELASLLVGDSREAYTVKFAQYFDSQDSYGGLANTNAFADNSLYCAGYESYNNLSSPFGLSYGFNPMYSYGSSFLYRGTYYNYNPGLGCYAPSAGGLGYYGYGYGYAGALPFTYQAPRIFDLVNHRSPFTPRHPGGIHAVPIAAGPGSNPGQAQAAGAYRNRGLIAVDDPTRGSKQAPPRVHATTGLAEQSRPSIQQMVSRHGENGFENRGQGRTRAQFNADPGTMSQAWSRPAAQGTTGYRGGSGYDGSARVYTRPSPGGEGMHGSSGYSGSPRYDAPRASSGASHPAESARSAPAASSASSSSGGSRKP